MLRDEVEMIAAEVKALSESHDIVITSGGLGPTLDDVTMQAVAGARCVAARQAVMCAAASGSAALIVP